MLKDALNLAILPISMPVSLMFSIILDEPIGMFQTDRTIDLMRKVNKLKNTDGDLCRMHNDDGFSGHVFKK
jgi:hypothetical protein